MDKFIRFKTYFFDLSSLQCDGSHTPTKNGGDAVGYQVRKVCITTNSLFLCDNQGVMLSIATPQEGQHHDLFEIQTLFDELCQILKNENIDLKDLFLSTDLEFDSEDFRKACEKEKIIADVKST